MKNNGIHLNGNGLLSPEDERDALFVLRQDPWAHRSNSEVGRYLGLPESRIKKLREKHNIVPDFIDRVDPRTGKRKRMWAKNIGKRVVRLTLKQQALVEEAWPEAQITARIEARSGILREDELLSMAKTSLMESAVYWDPDGRRHWIQFAWHHLRQTFARESKKARERHGVVTLLRDGPDTQDAGGLDEFGSPEERETLVERYGELRGLDKLVVEQIAGLLPPGPRSAYDLSRYWCRPVEVIQEFMIDPAREAMSA